MAETKEKQKTTTQIWINPTVDCDCECTDDEGSDTYRLTYAIPGIKKKDIDVKVIKDALRLTAKKGDIEYVNEFPFVCDAVPENVQAEYEDGLLIIDVPLDCPNPFRDGKSVKIN